MTGEHRTSGQPSEHLAELEVALLGLLSIRPMTGYEISRHYTRGITPWWDTPRTQIYPKLREMQRRGLIGSEFVPQEGKPTKRVYSIGPAGTAALVAWLTEPIRGIEMKHHMLVRLFLGNLLPADTMRALLNDYRTKMTQWAATLREAHRKFSGSLSGPYRASVFFELVALDHLIAIADLEASGTTTALEALAHAPEDIQRRDPEQLNQILEVIRTQSR
ncbi:MAG: PadR family transcriptional regulator [Pseudonocardia sp.]|nr:PadR family transcriptional regulator [Pseudonocardia sp.]